MPYLVFCPEQESNCGKVETPSTLYTSFKDLAREVSEKIEKECPGVNWKESYATMGRFDVVDIVESDDPKQVEKAALIIRSVGNSMTETLSATPWNEFLDTL